MNQSTLVQKKTRKYVDKKLKHCPQNDDKNHNTASAHRRTQHDATHHAPASCAAAYDTGECS